MKCIWIETQNKNSGIKEQHPSPPHDEPSNLSRLDVLCHWSVRILYYNGKGLFLVENFVKEVESKQTVLLHSVTNSCFLYLTVLSHTS